MPMRMLDSGGTEGWILKLRVDVNLLPKTVVCHPLSAYETLPGSVRPGLLDLLLVLGITI